MSWQHLRALLFRGALVVLTAVGWAWACGDGATEPPPDQPRPAVVTVSPDAAEITALGETVQLTASVSDQNGRALAGTLASWSSSGTAVATVTASGLVTAVGNGTATIAAVAGEASGTAEITVDQAVSAVSVSPAAHTVQVGATLRLSAEATDANGHAVEEAEFAWESGDTVIAAVNATGLVTALGVGEVDITAISSDVTGRAALSVVPPAPTTMAVTPDTVALTALGQSAQFAAEVRDQAERVMTDAAVSWASGDTAVAVVDSTGSVTAVANGTATITAVAGEASGHAVVQVMQSAGSIIVTPTADSTAPGDTLRLSAVALDENGHAVVGANFNWSSSNGSVATVDTSGLVRGVAEGAAMISAVAGSAQGTAWITVVNPDRAALEALYYATGGPDWERNDGWLTDAPLNRWWGVTTSSGRVVRLRLWGNKLTGAIPPEIGSLSGLRELELGYNQLAGAIPPELGNLTRLERLWLHFSQLTGAIPPEFGNLASLGWLVLHGNQLTGAIPPELGKLVALKELDLNNNNLTGATPPDLGNLASLESLDLTGNQLTGAIPPELLNLSRLKSLYLRGNAGLCVPGTERFGTFVDKLEWRYVSWCSEADVAVLKSLFNRTGGSGWRTGDGWLDGFLAGTWHGVTTDSLGRVTKLHLVDNNLEGGLPTSLGTLGQLVELKLSENPGLVGRLPLTLARVPMQVLEYGGTGLCAPGEIAFQSWLASIGTLSSTGQDCEALSDRDFLETLYRTTDGPKWSRSYGWLTDAPLGEWHGVTVDSAGRVTRLGLHANQLTGAIPPELGNLSDLRQLVLSNLPAAYTNYQLTGTIPPELGNLTRLELLNLGNHRLTGAVPPELGNLASLESLWLYGNRLTGTIPPELGGLVSLESLSLASNRLTGTIPPELGDLVSLESLSLGNNQLTGTIPPGLGHLVSLESLWLYGNRLTGPLPPGLGNLASLESLNLSDNRLTGTIPPELGNLASLESLNLSDNRLSGTIPPELGNLASLEWLSLSDNPDLTGPLPTSFTRISTLRGLRTTGTNLCAPLSPAFQQWLQGLRDALIPNCGGTRMAYLTQAVQSRDVPVVPLVADEEALLRVFVTATDPGGAALPPVRARFYQDDRTVHVADVAAGSYPIPKDINEGFLWASVNTDVPREIIQPGLELVIEVDPEGTLDPTLGVAKRIPAAGRLRVDVREMPVFDLTVIPFLWTDNPDSTLIARVEGMAADPYNHELLQMTADLLPIGEMRVTAHPPVLISSLFDQEVLSATRAIGSIEGNRGHYMGIHQGGGGLAVLGGRSSVSPPAEHIIAHELGHNFSLFHAPCGISRRETDYGFPSRDGSIALWGYARRDLSAFAAGTLVPPTTPDLMSYCDPAWISGYHFTKAMQYRLENEARAARHIASPTPSLLLWGGTDSTGTPFLEPSFVVSAPPSLPESVGGEWTIEGRDTDGSALFTRAFSMPKIADADDGTAGFVFLLPIHPGWASLASITLTGPGGTTTMDASTDRPLSIWRDAEGQVRAIVKGELTMAYGETNGLTDTGLNVLFSRGIPLRESWR